MYLLFSQTCNSEGIHRQRGLRNHTMIFDPVASLSDVLIGVHIKHLLKREECHDSIVMLPWQLNVKMSFHDPVALCMKKSSFQLLNLTAILEGLTDSNIRSYCSTS